MYAKILCASALVLCSTAAMAENKWQPTFELEGRTNTDRSLVSPKFLIPLMQDDSSLLFTDIRSRLDDNSSEEYNLGLGYRTINNGWIFGGYAFADYLSSANGKAYWQGTAGLEALSENWDVRVNGYLPESTKHQLSAGAAGGLVVDAGGNFGLSTAGTGIYERALHGTDAEVGYKLPLDAVDLRVFGGAYHFSADGFKDVSGPKARFELTFNEDNTKFLTHGMELTFGVQYQNDGPREGTTTALAQFRIPFGHSDEHSKLSALEKRMTNFIERDVDVVTGSAGTASSVEAARVTVNGTDYTQGAIVNSATTNVGTAITNAGTNSLIIFDGNISAADTIEPLDGQTIIGGGSTATILGLSSGTTLATIPGTRPTLTNPAYSTIGFDLSNTNDVTIQGIDIVRDHGGYGVYAYGANNATITDINYSRPAGSGDLGFFIENSSNIALSNYIINGAQDALLRYSTNVSIDDSTFSNDLVIVDNTNLSGTGNTINNCASFGSNTGSLGIAGGGTCP